ncbi:MarR family transcriptional regulator [Photobacterium toruni]|uniref:Multiple antibiotic resistance protein MarR n=1 Tax=Photobacterium toruni TaxID=1935446 RepID=A0A1T4TSR8_9GAMM|nr:MarR family transcriptional regulator [Photobacterium toruni]MEC6814355.1 MarR family transcriptional regulator [Photobacterium toruni]SKA43368.1 Multiple antibiotic resistance protein MarR [Photobacterium toruni]
MANNKTLDNLFQLVHALKRQLHEQIEHLDLGITPMHVRVIKIIHKMTPCTAVDIATVLERDKAQITRLVNTLIDKELITKIANPIDKRSSYLCITDSGMEIVKQLTVIDNTMQEKITTNISLDEIAVFQQLADKMTNNLRHK